MAVNVRGVFLCYKYAGLAMIASGTKNGRIVGACSFAGKRGTDSAAHAFEMRSASPRQARQCAGRTVPPSLQSED